MIDDNFNEQSLSLPSAANALAISSYTQFLDKYPIVDKIDTKHWDYILTIAGIFVAVSQLNHKNIPEQTKDKMIDIVTNSVLELFPDGVDACEDCQQFVDRTYDGLSGETNYKGNPEYLFSDSLGSWIVWNLFGHAPSSKEERQLVRMLGGFIAHSFISWWE